MKSIDWRRVNYHTHTFRCGHAQGSDEEYVLSAIAHGYQTLGFSDHIFYPHLTGEYFQHMRGSYQELEGYQFAIAQLRKKYASQIHLLIGFESEYYDDYDDYYRSLLEDEVVDYLILGQHFVRENHETHYYLQSDDDQEGLRRYQKALLSGMESGYFSYVCHPDTFMAGYASFDETAEAVTHSICQTARNLDLPLEINLEGFRKGLHRYANGEVRFPYPHQRFWEIAAQYGCEAVIGVDAHKPEDLGDQASFELALSLIKETGIRLRERPLKMGKERRKNNDQ